MGAPFRLLIAYDGSPAADAMIDGLAHAGLPPAVQALVVSVAERWLPPPSVYEVATGSAMARGKEHAVRLAQRGARLVRAGHPAWAVEPEAHEGSPARVIVARAREWGARLIVVGSLGHSTLERMLIGSVSQKVANEAHCSVRVCRGSGASPAGKLLLAYDGRPAAGIAAAAVATRNWPKGTQVRLVMATGVHAPPEEEPVEPATVGRVEGLLAPIVEMLGEAGLAVQTTVREEDPKQLIVAEALRLGVQCIFAGSNDHSLVDRVLLGTVSGALVSRAPCDVEIAR